MAKLTKLHKIIVLSLVSFTLYGCNSDEVSSSDDSEKPSNNTVYTLTDSHSTNIAVIASPYEINVNLEFKNDNFQVGVQSTDEAQASNIQLNFSDPQNTNRFNVSYSAACDKLDMHSTCQITLVPNNDAYQIDNQSVEYYITATLDGSLTQLEPENLNVKSLTTKPNAFLGSGGHTQLTIYNNTGVDVDLTDYQFKSNDDQLMVQLPAALDVAIKNDVLPNGKHFVVDVQASTNHTTYRSQVAMVNSSGIDAATSKVTVIRPIVEILSQRISLHSLEDKTIKVKNLSPVEAKGVIISLPDLEGVKVISNQCQLEGQDSFNLKPYANCSITFRTLARPHGSGEITISKDINANFSTPKSSVAISAYTPAKLAVSIFPKEFTISSYANKEVTVTVVNNSDLEISDLNSKLSALTHKFIINPKKTTCQKTTVLGSEASNNSCVYVYEYESGKIEEPSHPNVRVTVTGKNALPQVKRLKINNYPEYYSIPQNASRVHDGLADNVTYTTSVDSKGVIYAGTTGGLSISKDGGKTFIYKTTADGLAGNKVSSIFIDSDDTLYIGTNMGLSISEDGAKTFTNRTEANGLGHDDVESVFVGLDGTIYAGTFHGLSISEDGGQTFENKTQSSGLGDDAVNGVFVDSDNNIYVATLGGLSISKNGGKCFVNKKLVNSHDYGFDNLMYSVFVDSNGIIYAGSNENGLYISTDGGDSFFNKNKQNTNGLGDNAIYSIFVDSDDVLYVGTSEAGLSISTNGGDSFRKITTENTEGGLGSDLIYNVFVDASSNIYAGNHSGLSISEDDGKHFTNITEAESLGGNSIYSVAIDSKGTIYAGGYNGSGSGLFISQDGGKSFIVNEALPEYVVVKSIFITSDDTIYVGTNYSLYISQDGGKTFIQEAIYSSVNSVFVDSSGYIYVATQSNGISISEGIGKGFITKTTANGLSDNKTESITVDSTGTIYVATYNGLSISTNGGDSFSKVRNAGLGGNHIYSVFVDSNDVLYAATGGGLSISTDKAVSFDNKTIANGLGSNRVSSVYVDSKGIIYAGANGLSISTDSGESFINKTADNGLNCNGIYSISKGVNDAIYVGTYSGLSTRSGVIIPKSIQDVFHSQYIS
ncbi:hypothetical protein L3V83_07365 [Thiotrichales bacterium 19X7-9]|nr:hypothetical protein [Thiotrichales bacterium 19X7-9]